MGKSRLLATGLAQKVFFLKLQGQLLHLDSTNCRVYFFIFNNGMTTPIQKSLGTMQCRINALKTKPDTIEQADEYNRE